MAMLAEPRQRKRYNLTPRGKALYEDNTRFGTKMLEKMGWSKGKGLGANENGSKDFVRVRMRNNNEGLGFEDRDDHWTQHEKSFSGLLETLNGGGSNDGGEENITDDEMATVGFGFKEIKPQQNVQKLKEKFSGESLEEKSKNSKARVHYKKFTKGKDLSQYSEKDLANIFGKKAVKELTSNGIYEEFTAISVKPDDEIVEEKKKEEEEVDANFAGVQTVSTGVSVNDYFKQKMEAFKNRMKNGFKPLESADDQGSKEDIPLNGEENGKKKSKNRKLEEVNNEDGVEVEVESAKKKKRKTSKETTSEESVCLLVDDENLACEDRALKGEKKKKKKSKKEAEEKNSIEMEENKNETTESPEENVYILGEAKRLKTAKSELKPIKEKKKKKSKREEIILPSEEEKEQKIVETEKVPKKKKRVKNLNEDEVVNEALDESGPLINVEKSVKKKKKSKKEKCDKVATISEINCKVSPNPNAHVEEIEDGKANLAENVNGVPLRKKSKKSSENTPQANTANNPTVTQNPPKKDVSAIDEIANQSMTLDNLIAQYDNKFNVYTTSSFCAEKFRNMDFERFAGSNITEVNGYSFDERIKLEVKILPGDKDRITKLWSCTINKYRDSDPKLSFHKYRKEVYSARAAKTKPPRFNVKTWKRKNIFQLL